MKKIISLLVILVIICAAFAGCKNNTPKDYSLAIGVAVTKDAETSNVVETVATIVTDADGKIVLCRLDCVDYSVSYDNNGALKTTAPTSKVELGANYKMSSGTWAEQGAALENYVKGKTQAEVAAIALDGGKPTDADLKASCSINVIDLLKAIDNAFKSEHKIAFKSSAAELKAGLSVVSSVKDSSEEATKNVSFTASFASAVMADGKVVASILDTCDVTFNGINAEGASTSVSFDGTKRELGDKYPAMPAGTWYVQADAYANAAIGKTADDIATLASEGVAGCTIKAIDYKAGIESAVKSAR